MSAPDDAPAVPPALTAQEWADMAAELADEFGGGGGALWVDTTADAVRRNPRDGAADMAALNAWLPDDSPHKIVPRDVALLRALAYVYASEIGECPATADVRALADKLTALLPPEPAP